MEGKNILVDYRFEPNLERVSTLVTELEQLKVELLVISVQPGRAKQATKTIPIIMITNFDPVATGLVDSLAHPGGNITGLTRLTRELSGKRLELLKEVVPRLSRIGVLWVDSPTSAPSFKDYEAAAHQLNMQVQSLEVHGLEADLEHVFQTPIDRRLQALVTIRGPSLLRSSKRIAELAIQHRLPSMCEGIEFVQAGGLISYSVSDAESFRRAAVYVDKILKGAKPADLPLEQPTKFELVINLKTAKQIGLTIPPNVLARADRVIR